MDDMWLEEKRVAHVSNRQYFVKTTAEKTPVYVAEGSGYNYNYYNNTMYYLVLFDFGLLHQTYNISIMHTMKAHRITVSINTPSSTLCSRIVLFLAYHLTLRSLKPLIRIPTTLYQCITFDPHDHHYLSPLALFDSKVEISRHNNITPDTVTQAILYTRNNNKSSYRTYSKMCEELSLFAPPPPPTPPYDQLYASNIYSVS